LRLDPSFVCSVCQAVERNPNQVLHLFFIWCWRKYEIKLVVLFWVVSAEGIKAGAKSAAIVAIATAIPTVSLLFSQWPSLSVALLLLVVYYSLSLQFLQVGLQLLLHHMKKKLVDVFCTFLYLLFFLFLFPFLQWDQMTGFRV